MSGATAAVSSSALRPRAWSPSGEQIEIRGDGHHAVIVEVSGGIRSYEVDGRRLLDGYGPGEMCSGARGQLLVPWPNRLRDGRYSFNDVTQQVPLTEPEKHNAIHGFLRWESWRVAARAHDAVVMEHTIHPRAGYPFGVQISSDYRVGASGLSVTVTATNIGDSPCPYGMGSHPYLQAEGDDLELCWLEAPGCRQLVTDERGIPIGSTAVENTVCDFRSRQRILGTELDTAFTEVRRDRDGLAWVRLWGRAADRGAGLWMDHSLPYYMLFTGDTLPDRSRRRRSLGVEPMTCAPNAFASGDGLLVLTPAQTTVSRWGITPLGAAP